MESLFASSLASVTSASLLEGLSPHLEMGKIIATSWLYCKALTLYQPWAEKVLDEGLFSGTGWMQKGGVRS